MEGLCRPACSAVFLTQPRIIYPMGSAAHSGLGPLTINQGNAPQTCLQASLLEVIPQLRGSHFPDDLNLRKTGKR